MIEDSKIYNKNLISLGMATNTINRLELNTFSFIATSQNILTKIWIPNMIVVELPDNGISESRNRKKKMWYLTVIED